MTWVNDLDVPIAERTRMLATDPPMSDDIDRLMRYLEALDRARLALDEARKLYPDLGLDHALDRLRSMMSQAGVRLNALDTPPARMQQ
jgi:DNA transposition AAA+ family ATPase